MANCFKVLGRKALSLLLTVTMVTSLMQVGAGATAIPEDQIDHVWHQGEEVVSNGVSLQKTATDLGDNTFEITLRVTTPKDVEVVNYEPAHVVLVIDRSNSMTNYGVQRLANAKSAAVALAEALLTEEGVKAGNQVAVTCYSSLSNTATKIGLSNDLAAVKDAINGLTSSQGTNIQAGLKEARDILDADSAFEGKQIVILLSDGEPSYSLLATGTANWVNCDCQESSDSGNFRPGGHGYGYGNWNNDPKIENLQFTGFDYNTQTGSLSYSGGVNTRVTATCGNCSESTVVTLSGSDAFYSNNGDPAIYEAGLIKDMGATVYSIFVGNDHTDNSRRIMNNIASGNDKSITKSDEDIASLAEVFQNIAKEVTTQSTTAGVVTDPMGPYVTIKKADADSIDVIDDKNLVWNVTETEPVVGEDGSKTYTVTYTVTLNTKEAGFESRVPYPANNTTTFTYWENGEKKELDFDIPEIWGENPDTSLQVVKIWDKNGKVVEIPESISVQLLKDGEPEGEPVELNEENQWSYQWDALDGDHVWTADEVEVPQDWISEITHSGDVATIVNVYNGEDQVPPVELTITKVWANLLDGVVLPESITYTVNGEEFTMTAQDADENGNWVDDIKVSYAETFEVEETFVGEEAVENGQAGDWTVSVDGYTITNTFNGVGALQITKTSNAASLIPADTLFTITGPEGFEQHVAYGRFVDGVYKLENLLPGVYTVVESGANVEGYTLEVSGNNESKEVGKGETAAFAITNNYTVVEPDKGSLKIVKNSNDASLIPADAIFTVDGPEGYHVEIPYSSFNNGSEHLIEGLEIGTYTVTESGADAEGHLLTVTGNGAEHTVEKDHTSEAVILNQYQPLTGGLKIEKITSGIETPAEAVFTITGPNDYSKTVTYSEFRNVDGRFFYELRDLPVGSYTVSESNAAVQGYDLAVTGSGAEVSVALAQTADAVITNAYTKTHIPQPLLSVTKEADKVTANPGDTITYTITVKNTGDAVATGLTVVDTPDSNLTIVDAGGGEYVNGKITWKIGALGKEVGVWTATVKATVKNTSDEVSVNTVAVTDENGNTVQDEAVVVLEGSLTIRKAITGLDSKTLNKVIEQLSFTVTDPNGESNTYDYDTHFRNGVLVLKNVIPGTYTVVENNADAGSGYVLDNGLPAGENAWQIEVREGGRAETLRITNQYQSKVYNIWFDGGDHGVAHTRSGEDVDGVYRNRLMEIFAEEAYYAWSGATLRNGDTVYQQGSGTIYPVQEDITITDGMDLILYTFTWADWLEHADEMHISKPGLSVAEGYTSDKQFYLNGGEEAFSDIEAAIEYMNNNPHETLDENGFYNAYYVARYEQIEQPSEQPPVEEPQQPSGSGGLRPFRPAISEPDAVEIPEEDVPLTELPEEDVPLTELPDEEVPLEEIPDEEVPLADVPKTGDTSGLYMIVALISAAGLAYLTITGKKREDETA